MCISRILAAKKNSHFERSKTKPFLYTKIANFEQSLYFYAIFRVQIVVSNFLSVLIFCQYSGMFNLFLWNFFIYIWFISFTNKVIFIKLMKMCFCIFFMLFYLFICLSEVKLSRKRFTVRKIKNLSNDLPWPYYLTKK